MPQQEVFYEQSLGDRRIQVLKTYDQSYARDAFDNMDETARRRLWNSLELHENYEPADLPQIQTQDGADFMWDELLEAAHEDGNVLSFFVVNESGSGLTKSLYVSPDWPSAEGFAMSRLTGDSKRSKFPS